MLHTVARRLTTVPRHAFNDFGKPVLLSQRVFKSSLSLGDEEAYHRPYRIPDSIKKQNPKNFDHPFPDFNDSRAAFESKSTKELVRAAACFRLCRIPPLVNNAESLLRLSRNVLGNRATDSVLKATLFGHFCAGEDRERIQPVLKELDKSGIGSILDYAAESDVTPTTHSSSKQLAGDDAQVLPKVREYDYESEAQCDKHVEVFRKCINDAASLSKDGYAAMKVTALGNPKLLARMSQAIVEAKKLFEKFDTNHDGYISREEFELGYNLFFNDGDSSLKTIFEEFDPKGTGNMDYITWSMMLKPTDLPKITSRCKKVGPLALSTPTEEEIELIEAMYKRVQVLGEEASKVGTRLLIDAEQFRFQPAIDSLVLDLQKSFNATAVGDKPIIYNTYQCYLKDAPQRLHTDVTRSERFDYHFGAKLVRGAYMESERLLASLSGLPSPIWDTIEETHDCYNGLVDFLLRHSVESDHNVEFMCATHNQESLEKAIEAMKKYQVDRKASTVCFAQLYGMSDHLSFNLGRHGYRVYKYVPYGEVHEVIPYLLRRARENSSIVGGASQELSMIQNELWRRVRDAFQLQSST